MWGSWFMVTAGGTVGVVLLIGALVLSAWTPVFALLVAAVLLIGGLAAFLFRRAATSTDATPQRSGGDPLPRSGGAPLSGEGGLPR